MMPSGYSSSNSGGNKWYNFLHGYQGSSEIYTKSSMGGFLTILAAVIICLLCRSEISSFRTPEVSSHMTIEKSMKPSSVQLVFDIDFFALSCDSISYFQESTRSSMHSHEPEKLTKEPLTFKGGIKNLSNKSDIAPQIPVGCHVFGHALIDKAHGNFKFGKNVEAPPLDRIGKLIESDELSQRLKKYDLTHRINKIMFIPLSHPIAGEDEVDGVDHPLNGHKVLSGANVAVNQYSLQVVETELAVKDSREYVKAHQYSVTQRDLDINLVSQGVNIQMNPIKNFWGLVFLYDFYPISIDIKQQKKSFLSFLGSLCGILGGVFTMFSLFERMVYSTTKKVLGKRD